MVAKSKNKETGGEVELLPDAWERFERATKVIGKSPPQHRKVKKKKEEDRMEKKPGK